MHDFNQSVWADKLALDVSHYAIKPNVIKSKDMEAYIADGAAVTAILKEMIKQFSENKTIDPDSVATLKTELGDKALVWTGGDKNSHIELCQKLMTESRDEKSDQNHREIAAALHQLVANARHIDDAANQAPLKVNAAISLSSLSYIVELERAVYHVNEVVPKLEAALKDLLAYDTPETRKGSGNTFKFTHIEALKANIDTLKEALKKPASDFMTIKAVFKQINEELNEFKIDLETRKEATKFMSNEKKDCYSRVETAIANVAAVNEEWHMKLPIPTTKATTESMVKPVQAVILPDESRNILSR
ncbi:MAG: hypothetical protein NTU49_07585 [Gammaproteobacteria bacterium]|nr:hypothetical protein [Gammaproteobacteria bacterium]